MKKQAPAFAWRGKYLLVVVAVCYAGLFVVHSAAARAAAWKSMVVLAKILPIIALVILFTAVINYFLQPRQVARHLGRESGAGAWFWALLAGVISHGPMYAWYPMLEDLRSHGMRDGLIVVFFFSRAIKIPLLPMMIDYFGWGFTLVLSFYILTGALVQGRLLEFFEGRRREAGKKGGAHGL
jgi:uncharacterized membrane protein YraQ (UPF0718 family)